MVYYILKLGTFYTFRVFIPIPCTKSLAKTRLADNRFQLAPAFPLPVPEVIEESGPVQYCEEDAEEEGLDDEDMDELAYEGDPLLNSDYEEEGMS